MHPNPQPFRPESMEDWSALKDAVKRFEADWQQGRRPAIDDYLPARAPLRLAVLIELAHIDLELRLKAEEAGRAEDYLNRYAELREAKSVAVGLIAAEHELRQRREPGLSVEEYLERFPQYRDDL